MSRAHKHMLAYPFADTPITAAMARKLNAERGACSTNSGGDTFFAALTHLIFLSLQEQAREAHGERAAQRPEFVVGAGLVAHDLAKKFTEDLERHFVYFLDADGVEEALKEEIERLGEHVLRNGVIENGTLRLP